jgi:hypothetical protein
MQGLWLVRARSGRGVDQDRGDVDRGLGEALGVGARVCVRTSLPPMF